MVVQKHWRIILKIIIVSDHRDINGSPINLLDFQDYLINQLYDVVFYTFHKWNFENIVSNSLREYKIGDVKTIRDVIIHRRCNVVTDFMSLVNIKVPIICKNLIVFDNAELSYHLNGITNFFYKKDISDLRKILEKHRFSKVLFLMPKCNYEKFKVKYPDLPSTIFYKKINIKALLTVPFSNNQRWFYRAEKDGDEPSGILEYHKKNKMVDKLTLDVNLQKMFDYHGYIYYRRKDRSNIEEFGRSIFEFLIMGKKVHYFDHPNNVNDGLKDYWNYYGQGDKEIIRIMMSEDYEYKPWLE